MAAPVRVLIVDDSVFARTLLREALEQAGGIVVVGEAANGAQAVQMARDLRPNLITMDLEMPVMGGLQAIEAIMSFKAVPILVVSDVAHADNAMEALDKGALEVMQKPDYGTLNAGLLAQRVRLLAGVSVVTRVRPGTSAAVGGHAVASGPHHARPLPANGAAQYQGRVIAIASSTGGTQALAHILAAIPADFAASVLIAQHISEGFVAGLAEWLGRLCSLPVRVAEQGEPVTSGVVLIAPPEYHMSVSAKGCIHLATPKPQDIYHPSCDVLLQSVAQVFGVHSIGVILTGIGRDGAEGMGSIRTAGGVTIAQDEASSLIYGMNRVAVERGYVQHGLPLEAIAGALQKLASELAS